jgi:hypothetical protein
MDLIFDLTTLKMPLSPGKEDTFSAAFDYESRKIRFSYRQPNGADQEAISGLVPHAPYRALLVLLSRCLHFLESVSDLSEESLSELPGEVVLGIEGIIAEGMASFDWDIALICPECGKGFVSTLDICELFWEELKICRGDLWSDVHTIAFYYHWSEGDILSLSRWKRKLYLGHIQNHLMAGSSCR